MKIAAAEIEVVIILIHNENAVVCINTTDCKRAVKYPLETDINRSAGYYTKLTKKIFFRLQYKVQSREKT